MGCREVSSGGMSVLMWEVSGANGLKSVELIFPV